MPLEKIYKDQSQSRVSESLHWFLYVRRQAQERGFTATSKGSLKELVGDFLRDSTPAFLTILL